MRPDWKVQDPGASLCRFCLGHLDRKPVSPVARLQVILKVALGFWQRVSVFRRFGFGCGSFRVLASASVLLRLASEGFNLGTWDFVAKLWGQARWLWVVTRGGFVLKKTPGARVSASMAFGFVAFRALPKPLASSANLVRGNRLECFLGCSFG